MDCIYSGGAFEVPLTGRTSICPTGSVVAGDRHLGRLNSYDVFNFNLRDSFCHGRYVASVYVK